MAKSILQEEQECYVCHTTNNLHKHHIFGGANRVISEKQGCWVYLCAMHHNMSDRGVHFDKELDLHLKEECQRRWEKMYEPYFREETRMQFVKLFGRSWI